MGYNKVILIGTVDSEPEIEKGYSGQERVLFYVKTEISLAGAGRADAFPVVANSPRIVEYCLKRLRKNATVIVEGWLRNWIADDRIQQTHIVANVIRQLDEKPGSDKTYRLNEKSDNW